MQKMPTATTKPDQPTASPSSGNQAIGPKQEEEEAMTIQVEGHVGRAENRVIIPAIAGGIGARIKVNQKVEPKARPGSMEEKARSQARKEKQATLFRARGKARMESSEAKEQARQRDRRKAKTRA